MKRLKLKYKNSKSSWESKQKQILNSEKFRMTKKRREAMKYVEEYCKWEPKIDGPMSWRPNTFYRFQLEFCIPQITFQ